MQKTKQNRSIILKNIFLVGETREENPQKTV